MFVPLGGREGRDLVGGGGGWGGGAKEGVSKHKTLCMFKRKMFHVMKLSRCFHFSLVLKT